MLSAGKRGNGGVNLSDVLGFYWFLVRGRLVRERSAALSYHGEEYSMLRGRGRVADASSAQKE